MLIKRKSFRWIIFGLASLLIRILLEKSPEIVEQYYSRGFFQLVRSVSDWTIGWIPFPFLYLMILIIPPWLIWLLINAVKSAKGWKAKVFEFVISLLGFLGGVIALFLWLWGFNYLRVPIEDQIGINPKPLSAQELKEELDYFTGKIIDLRKKACPYNNNAITASFIPNDLNNKVQDVVVNTLLQMNYPASGRLPVRTLFKGSLLRIGTAGFYLPFTGECNLDGGLHPLQKPHVMAHEMAHGQGIGDEGSCNFIAYLSCTSSTNPFIQYSGYLSFWRTLAVNYRKQKPAEYVKYRAALPPGIIADLDAINTNSRSYPDIFPELRDQTYDAFLKTQGIKEGMKNYNRVIVLERAFRMR